MHLIRGRSGIYPAILVQLNYKGNLNWPKTLSALADGKNIQATVERELTVDDLPGPHSNVGSISLAKKFISGGLKLLAFQQRTNDLEAGKIVLKAQVRNVEKFGPIYRTKFAGLRLEDNVKIARPSDVATVLRSEGKIPRRPESPVMEYYRRQTRKPAGLIFDNGLTWYNHRKRVNERMLQPRSVTEYGLAFNEIVTDFVARLERLRGSHGVENEIPQLEDELFKWSFESVSLLLFDERFGALEDTVKPEVTQFIDAVSNFLHAIDHVHVQPLWLHKFFPTKMYKQFADNCDKLYGFTEKAIESKLKEFDEKGTALQNQSEKVALLKLLALNSDMTREDLLATYVDIYFAGVDTTATAILWSLYLLAKHQDKQLKLYQEISSVLDPEGITTSETLSKLPYLKACIKEVLRLYGVFHLHRITEQDLVLSGYKIPAGTQVMILTHAMSMSEENFEDPCSFKPERWLRDRKPSHRGTNIDAFASLPFGFGARMCVGRRASELEQYLLLTRIVQNYQLIDPVGETVERTIHGVAIIPDRPVRVKFVKREKSTL